MPPVSRRAAHTSPHFMASVNNLARSAATVRLTVVKPMATRLFHSCRRLPGMNGPLPHHASLREGLLEISKTVQELRTD